MRSSRIFFTARLFLTVLLLFFVPVFLHAAGTTTGAFLLVDIQARETALGGIFSPFYAKPEAASVNPACLQGIKNKYIMFSHYSSVFSTHYEQIEYAQPMDISGAAAVQIMFSSNDELYRTDSTGLPVEKIDNYDAVVGLSYSRALNEEYNIGAALKLVSEKLYDNAVWGGVLNLGVLYRNYYNRYTVGADLENLGISTAYFKDKSLYPILFRAGYGMDVYRYEEEYKISIFVEERIYLVEDDGSETSFGMEASYKKFFVFRYGYIFGKKEGRVAVGAGVRIGDLYIDYAYQPYFISDNAHRVTVKYVF
jgi:hypothetical protein